ncbi:MAG: AAA family ATPase [Methanomassiliicoccales archaeon]|jgi:thymidylate kinase
MFVIVEGPNGAGKTTLIRNFANAGYTTLSSPNGTPLATMLRPVCRGTQPWEDVDKVIQFLCFSAARMDEYVRIVHNKPDVVVADRWWTSTYVYQCVLQGIPIPFLEYTIHPHEKVHQVILLDASEDVLIGRVKTEREQNPAHGSCSWTKMEETQRQLIQIYRNDLPKYLTTKNIPCSVIDTTNITTDQVFEMSVNIIKSHSLQKTEVMV